MVSLNIKEASSTTGVSADTIRYYERIGLIMPIERVNGIRKFNERNINQINFAKTMREAGLSIETLKDYVTLVFEDDPTTIPARKNLLGEAINTLNEKVKEVVDARDYLQWKIDNYDSHMVPSDKKL
ncbi:MerR family transcriptional regulator [Oenococcus oeni]|uniref:MerR family transcriptional regulator n=1 Tax=Oenococcus oeni TaxID=1247 RepID=UPI0037043B59